MPENEFTFIDNERSALQFGGANTMDDDAAFIEGTDKGASNGRERLVATARWRPAESLLKLKKQVDAAYPGRNTASDGFIGNAAHCPNGDGTGDSDHCPNIQDGEYRVVTAFDITHDPESGCNNNLIVEAIRASRDARVKYLIWNKRIANSKAIGGSAPWEWRPYSGSNPHTKHAHLSVLPRKNEYDDTSTWSIPSRVDHLIQDFVMTGADEVRRTLGSLVNDLTIGNARLDGRDVPLFFPNGIERMQFTISIGPKDSPLATMSIEIAGAAGVTKEST